MSFLRSPQRRWLDLSVGIVLVSMLVFGCVWIYHLNEDARQYTLDSDLAMRGQAVSTDEGCVACHTVDGSPGVGPSWKGMWGRETLLSNGSTVRVDAAYFRESIQNPPLKVVQGYPNIMLHYFLPEEDIVALIAFAQSLSQTTPD